jgi:nucleoside-diphosphate-sugar epimerase
MHKVLVTGITGFLGSHIAENLTNNNISVLGLKRKSSNIWRCKEFSKKIEWIDIDEEGLYINELKQNSFDTIIHSAWIGVESDDRNNWTKQSENLIFFVKLLEVAKEIGVKKVIFLGSQAEYGIVNNKINESFPSNALSAYAGTKLGCLEIMKSFCCSNEINWVWLRLFSVFGEKENLNWLIPSLVNSMLKDSKMDFTFGEQKYAYMYVKDFAEIIRKIVVMKVDSGIYNISSNESRTIKSLIQNIRDYINPNFILNFGALNYREGQSMHMEGNIEKIISQIGKIEFSNFDIALRNTLKYYLNRLS